MWSVRRSTHKAVFNRSLLPRARVQAIFLPPMLSTLRRNWSLPLFQFLDYSICCGLFSLFLRHDAAMLLKPMVRSARDGIVSIAELLLNCGWRSKRLWGGLYRAFAARGRARSAASRLVVLSEDALGCRLSWLMWVWSFYHLLLFELAFWLCWTSWTTKMETLLC